MENHPIPQDITGFQFKLIGNMTIKQFAYLATGCVVGWVLYSSSIFILFKIPFAAASVFLGVGFAFVPIAGRPMDTMLMNFIRALFSPTQFVYGKSGGHLYEHPHAPIKSRRHKMELKHEAPKVVVPQVGQAKPAPKHVDEKKEMVYFETLAKNYQAQTVQHNVTPHVVAPHVFDKAPEVIDEKKENDQAKQNREKQMLAHEQQLEQQLIAAKQREAMVQQTNPEQAKRAHQETIALEEELRGTIEEKEKLERQLIELNRRLEQQKKNFYSPGVVEAPKETKNIRVVPEGLGKTVGLPIAPDSPNVVSGIVKDPRGNPLANILVEVKDQDGNPVRAFKTNGLGHFASATALTNGIYTIEFEDPKEENKFDAIQFQAKGEIILPIEVISVDKREELRRELFN